MAEKTLREIPNWYESAIKVSPLVSVIVCIAIIILCVIGIWLLNKKKAE